MKIWKLNNDRETHDSKALITIGTGSMRCVEVLSFAEKLAAFRSGRRITLLEPVQLVRGPGDALLHVGLCSGGWVVAENVAHHPAMKQLEGRVQVFETVSFTSSLNGYCILNFLNTDTNLCTAIKKKYFIHINSNKGLVYIGDDVRRVLSTAGFPRGCFWELTASDQEYLNLGERGQARKTK